MARSRFALKRRFDVDLTSVWRRFDVDLTSTCLSGPYLSPCQVIVRIGALFTFHSKSRVVSAKYRDPRFSSSRCEIHWIRAHSHPDRCRERISKKYRKLTKIWPFWRFGRWNGGWKSELLLRLERELSEMSEPVQLGKTWMHAKERRKLLQNWAIGSIFRFWTKKWTCEKVNFCCDWRGSYLRCPSQCSLEKHECTRKNDENCSKTERLAAFSVFGPSEIEMWNCVKL